MVYVNETFLSTKQKFVVCNTDCSKKDTLFKYCRYEFTCLVKDQYFSIFTKDEQETCELCNDQLTDCLLYVDSFVKLEATILELP